MFRLISLCIFVLIMCGCATLSAKRLDVEGVGGDLWIKRIGSGSQMAEGRRSFEREGVGFKENGLLGATSVKIRQVSGS
ncbi:hypothetical protein GF373_04695, partial [bacterium]|nr:hypothetical protein [bacterium]